MYWLRWHCRVKDIAGDRTKLNKTKNVNAPTGSSRGQTTVILCSIQSRSPTHRQTTTEKVQSSVRDGTSSATVHFWQMTEECIVRSQNTGGDLGGGRGAAGDGSPKTWGGDGGAYIPQYFVNIIINCNVFVSFVSRLNRKIRVLRLVDCDSPCFLPVHNTADFSRRTSKTVHRDWTMCNRLCLSAGQLYLR